MRSRTRSLVATTATLAALASISPAPASAQTTSPAACPATFEVLHDDKIGRMSLPKGSYAITLLDPAMLSCAQASDLLRQFLEDWDGRLPRPWVADPATRTFTRGAGGSVGFSLAASGSNGGGGGGHHPHGGACPGTFQVLHDDHIGTFLVPKGNYLITPLSVGRISCTQAASFFAQFLQDFNGILPRPWLLDRETGSFMRGRRNVGFRVKELVGPHNPSGGGGGTHPSGDRCPGTFRVLGDDRIGRLKLRAGPYRITLLSGALTCRQASTLFASFLRAFTGVLPRPWRLNVGSATFSRGSGETGFRVKPAR